RFAPPHAGNDAEGPVVVPTLEDAHVMTDASAPGLRHRLAKRVVVASLQVGDELVVLTDRHHRVKLWESPPEVLSLLGHDAPGDRRRPVGGLPRAQLME